MEGMLRIIQKRLRMALFFSRLVITYYFDQEIFVYANCAVHYFCQWEQWYWKLIYVLLSNVCFPGMCWPVFCRQFYRSCFLFYIDVIMLVQIFSILLILFTWNQDKICFKGCTKFISYRCAASFGENVVILLWVHAFNCMFLQMYMLILIILF